jgi:photosystem II stability/assembly factor-like uncharacterized protein
MKNLLRILFFFFLVTQVCFAQWYQQNNKTTKNLNAVTFIDDNSGFVVGDSGIILHSTNAGAIWEQQTSGTTVHLNDVLFINESNGWIVGGSWPGQGNILLHTTDAGVNWIKQLVDTTLSLNSVFFLDENIGWIGGSIDTGDGYSPVILKTIDGGTNWLLKFIDASYTLNNDVYFINADVGFAVGGSGNIMGSYGYIFRTTDGGETWIEQIGAFCNYQSIEFVDEQNGIAVGWGGGLRPGPGIYYTNDWGVNWHIFNGDMSLMNSVAYLAHDCAWVVGGVYWTEGTILFSSNGGIDWTNQGVFSSGLNSVSFINSSTGWAVGDNGTILHTTNGGVTFVEEEEIDEMPTEFLLSQNYPNPFNPSTKIKYSVPQSSQVQIKVFDVLGNEIATLLDEEKSIGTYELTWNASSLPSGVYFYQLRAGSYIETKKMLLLK